MTMAMLDCIHDDDDEQEEDVGYCQLFHFNCLGTNVCDSWMKGGPITDYIEEPQDDDTMLGKRFI